MTEAQDSIHTLYPDYIIIDPDHITILPEENILSQPHDNNSNHDIHQDTTLKYNHKFNNTIFDFIPRAILKTTTSLILHTITSSIARKLMFTGTMYMLGGPIISSLGMTSVFLTGGIIFIT